MHNNSMYSRLVVAALPAFAIACGSSAAKQPEPFVAAPLPSQSTVTPARTLKTGELLGVSPDNLLLDPAFQTQAEGWGHFIAYTEGPTGALVNLTTRTYGATPIGPESPVTLMPYPGVAKISTTMMTAGFIGGVGPYTAKVWMSASDAQQNPVDPPADGWGQISITSIAPQNGKAASYDLARDDSATVVVHGRTWVQYRADIAGTLIGGGNFNIRIVKGAGSFWFVAPEVLPASFADAPTTKSLRIPAKPRDPNAAEMEAIAMYGKQPVRLVGARARTPMP
jgi:hypothetical protein